MKTHLTEDLLIQLQFDLLEPDAADQARQHLAECQQCRQQAEQLRKKFSALDLLREEMAVPEGLIERLHEFARAHGSSVNDCFLAALSFSRRFCSSLSSPSRPSSSCPTRPSVTSRPTAPTSQNWTGR